MGIYQVCVITAMGAQTYTVGHYAGTKKIEEIRIESLSTNGDPFDHYCGYDEDGKMIFSVNKLCPCDVIYL